MSICLQEYRCNSCHKLLFKGILVETVVEVKCRSCHTMNTVEVSAFNELLCGVYPCPRRVPVVPHDSK